MKTPRPRLVRSRCLALATLGLLAAGCANDRSGSDDPSAAAPASWNVA
jgi:hypothetical protein